MKIPSKEECEELLIENNTPSNVIRHSREVARFALILAERLQKKGIEVNKPLIHAAALLHDIEKVKKNHIELGEKLLKENGFSKVAKVVGKHGISHLKKEDYPKTTEEKLLYYSDKRTKEDKIVSLDERFKDLKKRYDYHFKDEEELAKKIEKDFKEIININP